MFVSAGSRAQRRRFANIDLLPAQTSIADGDELAVYDVSAFAVVKAQRINLLQNIAGGIQFDASATHTISIATSSSGNGQNLNVKSGTGSAGLTGGTTTITGGDAGSGNATGGNLILDGGAKSGNGNYGSVTLGSSSTNVNVGNTASGTGVTIGVSNGTTTIAGTVTLTGTGTITLGGSAAVVQIGGGATAATLRFMEPSGSGTNYFELYAVAMAGNLSMSAPTADAAGPMVSNGAGALSFAAFATQAVQETGTSTTNAVVPNVQQHHASACKGWVNFDGTGTLTIGTSYNVTSVTDNGVGDYTVNWTTSFSSANYAVALAARRDTSSHNVLAVVKGVASNPAAGSVNIKTSNVSIAAIDVEYVAVAAYGDQ